MARKKLSSEPATSAASEETSGGFTKTDKECCGPCPPAEQRCHMGGGKVSSRMVIPKSRISSSIGGPVSIDQIEIGKVAIRDLKLSDFEGKDLTFDSCTANDVELEIGLTVSVHFYCGVIVPASNPYVAGDLNLPIDKQFSLPSITFYPSEDKLFWDGRFSMQSQNMSMKNFSMTSEPVQNTTVNEITTGAVKMKCTSIPLETPLCTDLGVCIPVSNPMCPNNVITEETEIKSIDSKQISCPRVAIKETGLLNINIPAVTVGAFEVALVTPDSGIRIPPDPETWQVPVEERRPTDDEDEWPKHIVGLTANFLEDGDPNKPGDNCDALYNVNSHYYATITKLIMKVGSLVFSNVDGTVTTGSASSDNIDDINLLLKGIKIKGLNLCGMKIPEIEVEF